MLTKSRVIVALGLLTSGLLLGRALPRKSQRNEPTESPPALSDAQDSISMGSDQSLQFIASKLAAIEARIHAIEESSVKSTPNDEASVGSLKALIPVVPQPAAAVAPEQVEARAELKDLVDGNLKRGYWSDADRTKIDLLIHESHMSAEDYAELSDRIVLAVNRQELKTESHGFPLFPPRPGHH